MRCFPDSSFLPLGRARVSLSHQDTPPQQPPDGVLHPRFPIPPSLSLPYKFSHHRSLCWTRTIHTLILHPAVPRRLCPAPTLLKHFHMSSFPHISRAGFLSSPRVRQSRTFGSCSLIPCVLSRPSPSQLLLQGFLREFTEWNLCPAPCGGCGGWEGVDNTHRPIKIPLFCPNPRPSSLGVCWLGTALLCDRETNVAAAKELVNK